MKKILILNGSLGGKDGNTQKIIWPFLKKLEQEKISFEELFLNEEKSFIDLENKCISADGFLFISGTYWDSWGSPLQKFLEISTQFEGTKAIFSKPASVIISMHSVGGKSVLSRLQGVLNTQGYLIPPMSGMVYSLQTHLCKDIENSFVDDFWSLEDVEIVAHNLIETINKTGQYKAWPIDKKDPKRVWFNN